MGSALYALSCEDPLFRLRNEVTQVSITADAELRSDLPAGAELKQLFFPAELYLPCLEETGLVADCLRNYYEIEGVESLEEAINQHMAQNFFFQGSFFSEDEVLHFFSLQRGMNVNTGTYTFTVSFDFQDGTSVDLITEEVVLQ